MGNLIVPFVLFGLAALLIAIRAGVAIYEWSHERDCMNPECCIRQAQIARANAFLERNAD